MSFPLLPIVRFSGLAGEGFLTDHNRGELQITFEEIGNTARTTGGTKRGYVVARKRTFTLSWTMTPADGIATVDGYWSGAEIQDFYNNTFGSFSVDIYNRNNVISSSHPIETLMCKFTSFDASVIGRNVLSPTGEYTDMWNFSLSFEEV